MAETKHTPGPWSLPHFARPDVNCHCGYVLTGDMFGAVCTVHASGDGEDWQKHGDNPRFAEAVANAHLIAAAPELLAMLKVAQLWLDVDGRFDMQGINAAIAKAEGNTLPSPKEHGNV